MRLIHFIQLSKLQQIGQKKNVRNISQELHILLTPDKEHKKVFQDIPVAGFGNGKSLKDHLVRAKLPTVEITGRSES